MTFSYSRKTAGVLLLTAGLLTACGVIATPSLWRLYASEETSAFIENQYAVIDAQGNLYHAFDADVKQFLVKISNNGVEQWRFEMLRKTKSLTLVPDGILVLDWASTLHLIDSNGSEQWAFDADDVQVVDASSGQAFPTVYVTHYVAGPGISQLAFTALSMEGEERWTRRYDIPEGYNGTHYPVTELANGNLILLIASNDGLVSVTLDSAGNEVFRHDLGALQYNYNAQLFRQGDQIFLTSHQATTETLMALDESGAQRWAKVINGRLDCAAPSLDRIACIEHNDTIENLNIYSLNGAPITSRALNYGVPYSDYNGDSRIIYNGNGKWVVLESHMPGSAPNLASAILPHEFYSRFHVLDGTGTEISNIVTEPGKVIFDLGLTGKFTTPVMTAKGDVIDGFVASSDKLFVVGWKGSYTGGQVFSGAYSLE